MSDEWEHAGRLFQAGLLEESRQVIHRMRCTTTMTGNNLPNTIFQLCCARCSLILFPALTCSVTMAKWGEYKKVLLARRKPSGLFAARFTNTVLMSTMTRQDVNQCVKSRVKKLTHNDFVMVYKCYNCRYDLVFDTNPFKVADLEPFKSSGSSGASGSIKKSTDKEESNSTKAMAKTKVAVKQILGKRPTSAPTPKEPSGLDLMSFLKKL
jgi:RNase P subunit RPR2